MTTMVICECESMAHFELPAQGVTDSILNGPQHDYWLAVMPEELAVVRTASETLGLCADCRNARHGLLLETSEYLPPAPGSEPVLATIADRIERGVA